MISGISKQLCKGRGGGVGVRELSMRMKLEYPSGVIDAVGEL